MEEAGGARGLGDWVAPSLEELLPQLSREEQQRLQERLRKNPSPSCDSMFSERYLVKQITPTDALDPDNVISSSSAMSTTLSAITTPDTGYGGEFDAVKPLMQSRVGFRDQVWFHINFWARCRISNKIKRFFAEVHYKPCNTITDRMPDSIPIVEICIIIEEPLNQYRRSCAFCPSEFDILHPKGCRKFVCGNDKDRIGQRLIPVHTGIELIGMPFTSRPSSAPSTSSQVEEDKRGQF
ncbi:hypothetical protein ACP4OV_017372 [Aristida adscensionis]